MGPGPIAQSLIEYGQLNGLIAAAGSALQSTEDWLFRQNPQLTIGVGVVLLLLVVARAFRPPHKF